MAFSYECVLNYKGNIADDIVIDSLLGYSVDMDIYAVAGKMVLPDPSGVGKITKVFLRLATQDELKVAMKAKEAELATTNAFMA